MGFVGVGHAAVCTSEDVMKGKEHTRRWGGGRQGWQLLTHLYGLEKHFQYLLMLTLKLKFETSVPQFSPNIQISYVLKLSLLFMMQSL